MQAPITRRSFLAAAAAAAPLAAADLNGTPPASKMGIATTSYMTVWKPRDTYEFLEHCHALGAAGVQCSLNGDLNKVRARAEQHGMFIEAITGLPRGGDTAAFSKAVADAKAVGATVLRVNTLPGRRYETFNSRADFKAAEERGLASIHAAMAIVEKEKMQLAVENHKDWTVDEMVALLKSRSSEYVGVCLDFGNNVSLLDDPLDVAEKLAPYTLTTHVKDMGVAPYADGFLLSELPLGEGYLDLAKMVALVRQARPKTRFILEMITRDPLEVPCLTEKYWATFPERNGIYLARTMRVVRDESKRGKALPYISKLSHDAQMRLEEDNVKMCLHYAREKLNL